MPLSRLEGKNRPAEVAKAYVNQIARGKLYPKLNEVVGITICDFELWPDEGDRKIPMLSTAGE